MRLIGLETQRNPVPHSRKPPSFPQATVIPAHAGTQRKTNHAVYPPLRTAKGRGSAANAGDVRGGVIPVPPPVPSFPQATVISASHRHSRGRGNPEKNKSRRLPSPSQSEGDAERSERRGCPWRSHPRSPTCTVIPAKATLIPASHRHSRKPPSFPQATVIPASHRHSRARGNPEKNKSRRLPSPSHSEGDAERSERRGMHGAESSPFPHLYRHSGESRHFSGRNAHPESP